MDNLLQFGALMASMIGIFVTLLLMQLKIVKNLSTKEDVRALRSEMNERFEEVNRRFEEVNRRFEEVNKRFEEAAADREKIRMEISKQSTAASTERKRIEEQAREDSKEIKREINRQNQNYIEHLAYHGVPRANSVNEAEGGTR